MPSLHNLANIDPDRGPNKSQGGHAVGGMGGDRDLFHFPGVCKRFLRRTANQAEDPRGATEGEAAPTHCLGDGRIAHIQASVFGSVTGQVQDRRPWEKER